MNALSFLARALACASLLALLPLAAQAQAAPKSPPRLPANASESSQIPAGVDTGSPTTGGHVPLGTPVPPDASSDRVTQRTHSAAARAAARPDPLTRTGAPLKPAAPLVGAAVIRDASRPASKAPGSGTASAGACAAGDPDFRRSIAPCIDMADRAARAACVERARASRGCD